MSGLAATGHPEPLGVTAEDGGINVAVFSAHAEAVELCLFDAGGDAEVARVRLPGRTGDVVHGFVPRIQPGTRYGLRAHGPFDPSRGHRFNPAKLLVDPWATALDRPFVMHPALVGSTPEGARDPVDSAPWVPRAIVARPSGDAAPCQAPVPWSRTIVYELHVRGFTQLHPAVPPSIRGTLAALAHPAAVDHLVRLGVSSVELMPIAAAIDERHLPPLGLTNYWGYNPVAFLAPDPRLAPGGADELRAAVTALHAAGIEVLLDVVFNHTGEGDERGPTVSYRGLDNASWYRLQAGDASRYVDDAGTGNVLACDRPHAVRLVMDALRHWVIAAGVDGFRFDLATTLGRRDDGFDPAAPLIAAIAQDPVLRDRKLIAEPWDIGPGGYQLGEFPAGWGEWNDAYRDTVRRLWRGDAGMRGQFATRFAGSADVFGPRARPPSRSVNYVTAHDGFTLADLVSYTAKRNHANGEGNRDGTDANHSWNHGVEGPTEDPAVRAARETDVRSLLATLLFSRGTPMLAMGDELGRSQHGNNNAYAQDGPLTWIDWTHADSGLLAYTAKLVALRKAHPALRHDAMLTGAPVDDSVLPDVEWLRPDGTPMTGDDWNDAEARTLVALLHAPANGDEAADRIAVAIQAAGSPAAMRLPAPRRGRGWRRSIDSARPDAEATDAEEPMQRLAPRSVVLFTEERVPAPRQWGVDPAGLARLAGAAGIATQWWDLAGTQQTTSPDTQRALLAAMGLPVGDDDDVRAHLAALSRRGRSLPAARVVRANAGDTLAVPLAALKPGAHRFTLVAEDGSARTWVEDPAAAPRKLAAAADGRPVPHGAVALPALPPGTYAMFVDDEPSGCTVVATEGSCFMPPALRDGGRAFGVLAHLYSLRRPGDLGIGDFTALLELARASASRGAATIGVNPLHMLWPGDRERASPYHPSDRRFLDPIYVDVTRAPGFDGSAEARALLDRHAAELAATERRPLVDYPAVWRIKEAVLRACHAGFARFPAEHPLRRDHAAFVRAGGEPIARFARFQAIAARHPDLPWTQWPSALRTPSGAREAEGEPRDGMDFACWLQWVADRELGEAAAGARGAGLAFGFYRDLAVGAAPDGAEVWSEPDGFARGVSIGAPPDPFAADGQVWCLPPPNPLTLAEGGYARFRALVAANLRHAGALRIDHVMGLSRLFFVPDGASARDGAYVEYPLEDLLGVLARESRRQEALIVGEDLGTVPEGLRGKLEAAGVLSSVVTWLERDGRAFRAPRDWRRRSAASISTHDLPTIAGWWQGADLADRESAGQIDADTRRSGEVERAAEREALVDTLRDAGALPESATTRAAEPIAIALHRALLDSPCTLALLQADDLAGETVALNLPGTDRERPNWRRRHAVPVDALWETAVGEAAAVAARDRRLGD